MAYGSSNPPALFGAPIAGGPRLWVYRSTHTAAEVAAAGFISNGSDLGMQKGDFVNCHQSTAGIGFVMWVGSVTASSAATLTTVTTSS